MAGAPEPDATAGELSRLRQELAAAAEREAVLAAAINLPDVAFCVLDRSGVCLHANESMARRFGRSAASLIGTPSLDLFPPDVARRRRGYLEQVLRTRSQAQFEDERNGIWNHIVITPVLDAHGEVAKVTVLGFDITQQRQAEAALRLSENRLRQIIDLVPHFIFAKDMEGRFILANQATAEVYGTTVSGLTGRKDADFAKSDAEVRHFRKDDMEVIESGRPKYVPEERITDAAGRTRYLTTFKIPFTFSGASSPSMLGVSVDITDRRHLEEERLQIERQMQQTQKLESLGVLAGGIAHDFNNLLMCILGNADLALADLPAGSPAAGNLREIEHASRRAADLCSQMLAYSGHGNLTPENVCLNALVSEMVDLLKTSISKKAQLDLQFATDVPPFRGDATQVRQVVMNLVINASESLGDNNGGITVTTGTGKCSADDLRATVVASDRLAGRYVWVEVADTGCGMDAETQRRMFDPFFTTKFAGRGLGLAAVAGIVRGHGGAVKVASSPGKGTTFRVLFPAGNCSEDGARPAARDAPGWRGSGIVLLVDDEQGIRETGKRMLERLGFDVLTASDGRDAVEQYRRRRGEIRLVLLDLTMPCLSGEEAFVQLRELDPDVRVIMSSGFSEADVARRFDGKGLAGFVHKPYSLLELRRGLAACLGDETQPAQA